MRTLVDLVFHPTGEVLCSWETDPRYSYAMRLPENVMPRLRQLLQEGRPFDFELRLRPSEIPPGL